MVKILNKMVKILNKNGKNFEKNVIKYPFLLFHFCNTQWKSCSGNCPLFHGKFPRMLFAKKKRNSFIHLFVCYRVTCCWPMPRRRGSRHRRTRTHRRARAAAVVKAINQWNRSEGRHKNTDYIIKNEFCIIKFERKQKEKRNARKIQKQSLPKKSERNLYSLPCVEIDPSSSLHHLWME